jgi:hypothetical protein
VALTAPRLSTFAPEDIGSALNGGAEVCQRQLVNEVLGPLLRSLLSIWRTRARHLSSAASIAAFSIASRPSNSLGPARFDLSEPSVQKPRPHTKVTGVVFKKCKSLSKKSGTKSSVSFVKSRVRHGMAVAARSIR